MSDNRDELIRIDRQGVAHPIGNTASQRMRTHEGTYRVLPSPAHVVLMRYTGEDGQVDQGDGATIRIAGEITTAGTICDILALLAQTGWRGVLSIHSGDVTRKIYLEQGSVLGVKSDSPEEWLGKVLYGYGHLSEEGLERVESQVTEGRRFGEVALELGELNKEQVYRAFGQQITEVVVASLRVSDGTYFFLDGFDDGDLSTRQAVSVNGLLMAAVTRMDELSYFTKKVPSVDHVPAPTEKSEHPQEELDGIFEFVNGENSVREIGRLSGLGEFETVKKVYGLVQTQHVTMRPPQRSGGPQAIVENANRVLAIAFKHAFSLGRAIELRESLNAYAVGQGVFYDMLLQGAGPDQQGRLNPDVVAANAPRVADSSDVEPTLRKLLFDYVSFGLFSLGSALQEEEERELQREADEALSALRPQS